MAELSNWIQSAPQGVIAFATATAAALVALAVAVLTQWILGRRARTDLLTKKLEELYLVVLQWMDVVDMNRERGKAMITAFPSSDEVRRDFAAKSHHPRLDRRASMYILLYFPRLRSFDAPIFEANRDYTRLIRFIVEGQEVKEDAYQSAWHRTHANLDLLRYEILLNHAVLVRSSLLPVRRKAAT